MFPEHIFPFNRKHPESHPFPVYKRDGELPLRVCHSTGMHFWQEEILDSKICVPQHWMQANPDTYTIHSLPSKDAVQVVFAYMAEHDGGDKYPAPKGANGHLCSQGKNMHCNGSGDKETFWTIGDRLIRPAKLIPIEPFKAPETPDRFTTQSEHDALKAENERLKAKVAELQNGYARLEAILEDMKNEGK